MTSKDNIAIVHRSLTPHRILKQCDFDNYVLVKTIYTKTFLFCFLYLYDLFLIRISSSLMYFLSM
jgi:hypothetical protein